MFFSRAKKSGVLILTGFLMLLYASTVWSKNPMLPKTSTSKATIKQAENLLPQPPQPLTPENINAYLADMTDSQVRQVLAQKLNQAAAAMPTRTNAETPEERREGGLASTFARKSHAVSALLERVGSVFSGASNESDRWRAAIGWLSEGKGSLKLFLNFGGAVLLIACGLFLRRLVTRASTPLHEQILNTVQLGRLEIVGRIFARALLSALGIGVYMLSTFILFVLIYREGTAGYAIAFGYLICSYYLLLIAFAADIIFSPAAPALRLFPLPDADADFLYRWIIRMAVPAGIIAATSEILDQAGIGEQLYLVIYGVAGAVVILALVAMIFQSRNRVSEALLSDDRQEAAGAWPVWAAFARRWYIFAMVYVLVMGADWITRVFLEGRVSVINLVISMFLIPIFIGVDQWGQRFLKLASGELPEIVDLTGDEQPRQTMEGAEEKKTPIKHYGPLMRRLFRIVLLAFLFLLVLRLWGIDLSLGRLITSHVLGIIIALLLGFIIWEYTKARIDRKLREEMPSQDQDMEEGGAGGSRSGTLLLLLRKFILVTLFVVISLSILSSLGVHIAPLIAGAGVVGLAIGFGAQTLVKDILAGVFFLIDDAFRVGDYVEAGTAKGMVEHISLRSMKLRHPRGMVYNLHFGNLKQVVNFSRDYVIMKLDFRVRYDADVEKIRKIIKKRVHKKIIEDPELGPKLLGPIKSQGVREMDDSAMIMRVKYKTKPGDQFAIRKEVYHLMQEAFQEEGIEFAHRNVTVYMPPEVRSEASGGAADANSQNVKSDSDIQRQAAAAAALAVVQAEEEEAKKMAAERKSKK